MIKYALKTDMNVYFNAPCPSLEDYVLFGTSRNDILTAETIKELQNKQKIENTEMTLSISTVDSLNYVWICSSKEIDDISYGNMTIDYIQSNNVEVVDAVGRSQTYYCYRTTYKLKPLKWKFVVTLK